MDQKPPNIFNKKSVIEKDVPMAALPDWHFEPSTPLWEKWGETLPAVSVTHSEREVQLPFEQYPQLKEKREKLVEDAHNFNGTMANVEKISFSEKGIEIETSTARFFDYMAASSYFREKNIQKENPIRPLATEAVLLTPNNEIIFTRRPLQLFDNPGALSNFGGALKAEQTDITDALMGILKKKLGLELDKDQLEITGMDRENVNNIFCVFQLVRLTGTQSENLLEKFRGIRGDIKNEESPAERNKKIDEAGVFYKVSAEESLEYIERLLKHRDINSWNPTAYTNVLYALAASKLRSPDQILKMLEKTQEDLKKKPFEYNKTI